MRQRHVVRLRPLHRRQQLRVARHLLRQRTHLGGPQDRDTQAVLVRHRFAAHLPARHHRQHLQSDRAHQEEHEGHRLHLHERSENDSINLSCGKKDFSLSSESLRRGTQKVHCP